MLHLDITGTSAKALTPVYGIPMQDLSSLRTILRRAIEEWLAEREKGMHAWSMDPYDRKALDHVKEAAMRVKGLGIKTVVWIGIGGSGLGPKVLQEVFEGPKTIDFLVLDTIDPTMLSRYLDLLDWKSTLIVVASKSGDTLETMSAFFLCWERLSEERKIRPRERVIAITDPEKGTLHDFCLEHGIQMLALPPAVGGRYSIFTPIGTLAMALLDADVNAFLRGAKEMDTNCQKTFLDDNPAATLAAVQFLLDTKRGYPLRVIMPYSGRLQSLGRWAQQLIAESLGKTEKHNPIPVAAIGTQDQHSLLQQWMAGPRNAWHLFIREEEMPRLRVPVGLPTPLRHLSGKNFSELLDACYHGTSQALTTAKRPHATINLPRLDATHLGQLFFLLMTEVALLGKLYRIDPYGQPAVEIGKQITREILTNP